MTNVGGMDSNEPVFNFDLYRELVEWEEEDGDLRATCTVVISL